VEEYFTRINVPLTNIIAMAMDGATSMTSRHVGFVAHLKKAVLGIICVHCVIHRQNLTFPTTYLFEKKFSIVVQLLTKQRNRLDICNKGDLRLSLTNIELDIPTLATTH
jgi:hypothetical protein